VSRFKELKLPGNALDTLIERLGGTNKVLGLGFDAGLKGYRNKV